LRPEGPLLPAQAVRPGGHQWANRICEIGPAYVALSRRIVWSTATQASRPGLGETALQAENRDFIAQRGFVLGQVLSGAVVADGRASATSGPAFRVNDLTPNPPELALATEPVRVANRERSYSGGGLAIINTAGNPIARSIAIKFPSPKSPATPGTSAHSE